MLSLLALAMPVLAADSPLREGGVLSGTWPGADFGAVLSTAGDIDGDGFPDLAVGAPLDSEGASAGGRVVVYTASRDGTGYHDLAWTAVGTMMNGHYGGALAGGGDLDGDSFDDLVVASTYQGWRVDVWAGGELGLPVGPTWSFLGSGGAYGRALALPGDVNGDGWDDFLIGDALEGDFGSADLHLGGADGPATDPVVLPGDAEHPLGAVLDGAGDVDGDGLVDVLFAPGTASATASAAVYAGGPDGLVSAERWHLSRPAGAPGFGVAAGGGAGPGRGDLDGDGYDDVVIGADGIGEEHGESPGALYAWRGGATGPPMTASWTVKDDQAGTLLGRQVDIAGDVDGDGFADLAAGRPGWQDGESLEGGVLLLVGSALGPVDTPAWIRGSDLSASDHGGVWIGLGTALAAVGDSDLDGFADLAFGLPNSGADSFEARTGEVWLFEGQAWTPPAPDTGGDTGPQDSGEAGDPKDGCGCAASPPSPGVSLLGSLALLFLGRARRRAQPPLSPASQSRVKA